VLARSREVPVAVCRRPLGVALALSFAAAAGLALTIALHPFSGHSSSVARIEAKPAAAPVLACYEGDSPSDEEAAYSLRDAIAAVELDYEACLVVTPSAPATRRSHRSVDSSVTQALFSPLPRDACE
jgi:hypothetical protein